jgi:hypothetical protein
VDEKRSLLENPTKIDFTGSASLNINLFFLFFLDKPFVLTVLSYPYPNRQDKGLISD